MAELSVTPKLSGNNDSPSLPASVLLFTLSSSRLNLVLHPENQFVIVCLPIFGG